jgi:hypothetical protein
VGLEKWFTAGMKLSSAHPPTAKKDEAQARPQDKTSPTPQTQEV